MFNFYQTNNTTNNTEQNTNMQTTEAPSQQNSYPVPSAPHYSTAAVIERFKTKHFRYGTPEKLQEMVYKAERMAQYVVNAKDLTYQLDQIYTNAVRKTRKSLTTEEKHAKLFALALKVMNQFETCGSRMYISPTMLDSHGKGKRAPYMQLFGESSSFKVMTSESSRGERSGIIYHKNLGMGGFNQARLVYDLDKGEKVMRSLLPLKLGSAYDVNEWTQDVKTHQLLLNEHIPGIVNIENVFIINDSNSNPDDRSMELEKCDGDISTLKQILPLDKQKDIMKQLLTTFSEMHSKNIVHGDVKPANVLYVQKPDGIETKLSDFGTVHIASQGEGCTCTHDYATPVGWQLGYIGPQNTMKEDCFALGKIALELRYGRFEDNATYEFQRGLMDRDATLQSSFIKYKQKQFNGYDRSCLWNDLEIAYPNTPFYDLLDDKHFFMNGRERPVSEIYNSCFNAIIKAEYQKDWNQNMENILKQLMQKPDPYNMIIAQLLNPDSNKRITAQEALKNLTALIANENKNYWSWI